MTTETKSAGRWWSEWGWTLLIVAFAAGWHIGFSRAESIYKKSMADMAKGVDEGLQKSFPSAPPRNK